MADEALVGRDLEAALEALRDLLVERIKNAGVRETAALAKQYVDVMERLERLKTPEEVSELERIIDGARSRRGLAAVPDAS